MSLGSEFRVVFLFNCHYSLLPMRAISLQDLLGQFVARSSNLPTKQYAICQENSFRHSMMFSMLFCCESNFSHLFQNPIFQVADLFMSAIERVTSVQRCVQVGTSKRCGRDGRMGKWAGHLNPLILVGMDICIYIYICIIYTWIYYILR